MKRVNFVLRLSVKLHKQLVREAKAEGISKNALIERRLGNGK